MTNNATPPSLDRSPTSRCFQELERGVRGSSDSTCRCISLRSVGVGALPTTAYEAGLLGVAC